jgi:hypothetical protein
MKRVCLLLVLVMFSARAAAAADDFVLQTATLNAGQPSFGVVLGSSQALGAAFTIDVDTVITAVGGNIAGTGSLYAAIVALTAPGAVPAGNPLAMDELRWSATFTASNPSKDVRVPVNMVLRPGAYMLVFGSGQFGATGNGSMPSLGQTTLGSPSFAFWSSGNARWQATGLGSIRFVVTATSATNYIIDTLGTLATQASVDGVNTQVGAVAAAVGSKASQASVDGVALAVSGVGTMLASKASQASVDQANTALVGKASQASVEVVDGHVTALSGTVATAASVSQLDTSIDGVAASLSAVATGQDVHALSTALSGAISTRAAESTVAALAAQVAGQSTGVNRVSIERAIADGTHLLSLMLPASAGGHLDVVRQIVDETILNAQTAGLATTKARADFARADAAAATGDFRSAYDWFVSAYQRLLK